MKLFAKKHDKVYFGVLDYKDGGEVFRSLGLNSAPFALHIPPSDSKNPQHRIYDFNSKGVKAEQFVEWISKETGVVFKVSRPVDYTRIFIFASSAVLGLFLLSLFYKYVMLILENSKLWVVGSIVC